VHDKVIQILAHSVLVPNQIRFAYPVAASSISSTSNPQARVYVLASHQWTGARQGLKTPFSPIKLVLRLPSLVSFPSDLNSTPSTIARTVMEITGTLRNRPTRLSPSFLSLFFNSGSRSPHTSRTFPTRLAGVRPSGVCSHTPASCELASCAF
jgi:hypothetical protein